MFRDGEVKDHSKTNLSGHFTSAKRWAQNHRTSLNAWGLFVSMVGVVYLFFSDKDFSFLLTLSSLVSAFCFLMVLQEIEKNSSCAGVSMRMMECYLILLISRLCSILPFQGYLPYDSTGDWLYQLTEALSLCFCGTIVFMGRKRYASTHNPASDSFNHWYLIAAAFALACVFHPTLNGFLPADVAWTLALYLESVASLPQLFFFLKEKRVEPFTSHFLAGQAVSKVLSFVFWLSTYRELNDPTKPFKSYAGLWVVIVQVIQLIVMGDFIYHYVRCLGRGVPVQFFLNENV